MSKQIERVDVEMFAIVDEDGGYEVGSSVETAEERYRENVADPIPANTRVVKVMVSVPVPTVAVLNGVVAVNEDAAELVSAN